MDLALKSDNNNDDSVNDNQPLVVRSSARKRRPRFSTRRPVTCRKAPRKADVQLIVSELIENQIQNGADEIATTNGKTKKKKISLKVYLRQKS